MSLTLVQCLLYVRVGTQVQCTARVFVGLLLAGVREGWNVG